MPVGRFVSRIGQARLGAFDRHAEIFALLLRQRRELDADFFEVQTRDFFVELLRRQVLALARCESENPAASVGYT